MFNRVALLILDGWGIREKESGNSTQIAKTTNVSQWLREYERSILVASGESVGLPDNQMGNSEVGHLNLGAGRIVYQDILRIDRDFKSGAIEHNQALVELLAHVQAGSKVHLVGLLSSGGVHSHERHLHALIEILDNKGITVVVHAFSDGRDTGPQESVYSVEKLLTQIKDKKNCHLASVTGRYFGMDRDHRWERTKLAYDALVSGIGKPTSDFKASIKECHAQSEFDEFIKPLVNKNTSTDENTIHDGDGVIFFNYRSDRMRQLTEIFINKSFDKFPTQNFQNLKLISFTEYSDNNAIAVMFPLEKIKNSLAETLSSHGKKQFHAAETEKYPHVTYFFNGREETIFENEERLLVPSPSVATYDLQPEMSAYTLTEGVLARIDEQDDAFLLVNFANPDMVGHTGVLEAAVKAVEVTDECAGRIVQKILETGGVCLVTADHGNVECMIDEITGQPHTYHTTNPVSFFVIAPHYIPLHPTGILADVAPTVLHLLGIDKPVEMTGKSLINAT
nr:2,3-bisphosphoglycerate-independent phosphoglycerate mutase [Armatimonas sp.]